MPQKRLLSFSLFHTHFCLTRACRTQMNQCVSVCWMLCCYYCFIFNNEFEIRCIYIESNFIIWCVWMCSPVLLMIGRPFERWIHWIEKIKTEAKNQFAFVLTISVVDLCTMASNMQWRDSIFHGLASKWNFVGIYQKQTEKLTNVIQTKCAIEQLEFKSQKMTNIMTMTQMNFSNQPANHCSLWSAKFSHGFDHFSLFFFQKLKAKKIWIFMTLQSGIWRKIWTDFETLRTWTVHVNLAGKLRKNLLRFALIWIGFLMKSIDS